MQRKGHAERGVARRGVASLSYLLQVNSDFADGLQPAEAGRGDGRRIDFEGTKWEKKSDLRISCVGGDEKTKARHDAGSTESKLHRGFQLQQYDG